MFHLSILSVYTPRHRRLLRVVCTKTLVDSSQQKHLIALPKTLPTEQVVLQAFLKDKRLRGNPPLFWYSLENYELHISVYLKQNVILVNNVGQKPSGL